MVGSGSGFHYGRIRIRRFLTMGQVFEEGTDPMTDYNFTRIGDPGIRVFKSDPGPVFQLGRIKWSVNPAGSDPYPVVQSRRSVHGSYIISKRYSIFD